MNPVCLMLRIRLWNKMLMFLNNNERGATDYTLFFL